MKKQHLFEICLALMLICLCVAAIAVFRSQPSITVQASQVEPKPAVQDLEPVQVPPLAPEPSDDGPVLVTEDKASFKMMPVGQKPPPIPSEAEVLARIQEMRDMQSKKQ